MPPRNGGNCTAVHDPHGPQVASKARSTPRQRALDGLHHVRRVGFDLRLESLQHLPVAPDQELGEIPANVPWKWGLLARQHYIKRVAVRAVDLDLFEERKGYLVS